ncbi:response regulator [Chryseolinea lacunae]|uniref:Response regulator n=1 Tax=Chryseolinea lacunae TaxID=2801331 RepID=A0ABS1KXY6_9BACT|nr:response regulator [Chryseolinea lacunae]MBL0744158.1 response regulator [Chryseolinea lacunae]
MKRVIHILLIEDDTLDQMEVKRTLERRNILHRLTILTNGEEAIQMIENTDEDIEKPDIILLDLNMPKRNGFEVLASLRANDRWKDVKVFVLTTSDEVSDKHAAQLHGISGFITKPLKLESPSSLDAFNLMIDLMNI